MKLKNLLPLAGVTGIVAIAAPLVTSCAQKGTTVKYSSDDNGEEEGVRPFTVGKYDGEGVFETSKEATQAYLEKMDKNKTIFSKEIINSVVLSTLDEYEDVEGYVKEMSVRTDAIDVDDCTVSYHLSETIKIPVYVEDEYVETMTVKIEYRAKKLPVRMVTGYEGINYSLVPYLGDIEDAYDYLDKIFELANDKTGSYSIHQEDSDGYVINQAVDHSNVLNWTTIDDLALLDTFIIGSAFASSYFDIRVGG